MQCAQYGKLCFSLMRRPRRGSDQHRSNRTERVQDVVYLDGGEQQRLPPPTPHRFTNPINDLHADNDERSIRSRFHFSRDCSSVASAHCRSGVDVLWYVSPLIDFCSHPLIRAHILVGEFSTVVAPAIYFTM